MIPYEIMLSESQERMLLVADKGREDEVFRVFRKWGLDAVTIGKVTADGLLRVKDHGAVVAEIPNRELADEAPLYDRPQTRPLRKAPLEAPVIPPGNPLEDLEALLSSSDVCSKRWIWEQYDYMVRTNTTQGPGGDAAIVRIKETGTSVAMALDGSGRYCSLSPREGARLAVAECCRNVSTVGALPVAATNCLNFGNPERLEIMAQLVEAIEGMGEACAFFETPITGGNVSLYNETLGEAIDPTPVVGIVGLLKTAKPLTIDFKQPGRAVMVLGGIGACEPVRFGGTEYAKVVMKQAWGLPPALDMDYEKRVQSAMREVAAEGLAESAHDVSDGGLAVALAECSFGPSAVGASVTLVCGSRRNNNSGPGEEPRAGSTWQKPAGRLGGGMRDEFLLFHEGPSRIVISTWRPAHVRRIAEKHGVEAVEIGVTIEERLQIGDGRRMLIDAGIGRLRDLWAGALESKLRA
jgi:phosphoribosylformylglycinamidine synthase